MRQRMGVMGGIGLCMALLPQGLVASQEKPQGESPPTKPSVVERPIGEFRMVPVRVHLLRSPDAPAAGTKLTGEDIVRIFQKANGIWHAAGVHLWVESVVEEKPATVAGHESDKELPTEALLPLRPGDSHPAGMFHVYYIGEMSPNGIFMRRDGIFVKESARLRKVEGGIDEPLPRVTAHELGHGMSLPHRQDTFNLMASGTTGTGLNEAEIEAVRHAVFAFAWALTPEEFLKQADEIAAKGKKQEARSRYQAVIELPGDAPLKIQAQAHLKALQKEKGK